jgi:dUTP pyrophosphatase
MSKLHLLVKTAKAAQYYSSKLLNGEDAGFDLYVPEDTVFKPGERKMVGMGVAVAVMEENPVAYWMAPRSSISKTGLILMNSMGVIDKGYRGELIAALWNSKMEEVTVKAGDRLVQVVARDMSSFSEVVVVDSLPDSKRGAGGFGSTGK